MNIFPSKHINIYDSIFGLAGFLTTLIDGPVAIDNLWTKFNLVNGSKKFPSHHNHKNFILALDILFLIGAVKVDDQHNISLCN